VLRVANVGDVRYYDRGDRQQSGDDLSRIVKLSHMRVAGGEITIRLDTTVRLPLLRTPRRIFRLPPSVRRARSGKHASPRRGEALLARFLVALASAQRGTTDIIASARAPKPSRRVVGSNDQEPNTHLGTGVRRSCRTPTPSRVSSSSSTRVAKP
jgi:hypothetical protein